MKHKFQIGDRVKLTCEGRTDDANYGVEGVIVKYEPDDWCPTVKLCEEYTWNRPATRKVNWLDDDWWTLVEGVHECVCKSLL
nr:MAG TPA: SH3-like domain protein [Siphoviridae sp. ctHdl3]